MTHPQDHTPHLSTTGAEERARELADRLARWCRNTGFDGGVNSPPMLAVAMLREFAQSTFHPAPDVREAHDDPEEFDRYLALANGDATPVTRSAVQGWQPIESAPKDGTAILIFRPDKTRKSHMPMEAMAEGECSYKSDDPRLQWYDDERYAIGYWRPWGSWGDRNCATVNPTHWQPLPAPPLITNDGGAEK